jgi:hypothetical protein
MKRLALALICLLLLPAAVSAQAQAPMIERHFKGKPAANINVGIFASIHKNCTPAPLPTVRLLVPPAHGRVTVKQGRLRATNVKNCLAIESPAFVAIYRSERGFVGQDLFTFEIISQNGKSQLQKVTVTVMGAGDGRGI